MAKPFLVCLLILGLGACTSTSRQDVPEIDIEDRTVGDGQAQPLPQDPRFKTENMPQSQTMSPVVKRLSSSAQEQLKVANWEGAANYLERALRIEPQNAVLWGRLASVRYEQQEWRQAIQLAAKSNTLSRGNQTLRRQNWYLMSNAYMALGDLGQAQKYRDKLNQ